jgi:IS30 family transposase
MAAQAIEICSRLREHLQHESLRQIACWKMEGFTNDEIADRLSVVTRTVERKLKIVRHKVMELGTQDDESNV